MSAISHAANVQLSDWNKVLRKTLLRDLILAGYRSLGDSYNSFAIFKQLLSYTAVLMLHLGLGFCLSPLSALSMVIYRFEFSNKGSTYL